MDAAKCNQAASEKIFVRKWKLWKIFAEKSDIHRKFFREENAENQTFGSA